MITIEERIKLFYKLINQSMDIHLAEDLKEIEDSYKFKIEKMMNSIDKEAKEIEEKALKRAEIKRAESISKSKVIIKKDIMALKEKHYYTFMDKFKLVLKEFVDSNEYKTYLSNLISKLIVSIKDFENKDMIIYITGKDKEKYSDFINNELNKDILNEVTFKVTEKILGGFVVEFTDKNIKMDMSIDAVLEDNKIYIMKTIFELLEVGDYNE